MSDALKYLMQIRPEAMESYFSFVKKSGQHLDDKTIAIISVITKVDKQTEKGFRQYLRRALRLGVSANEIIDALFVAFPTLGLSKIVWAVDMLLAMDIAEFKVENIQNKPVWHKVMAAAELGLGASFVSDCEGKDLFIYKAEGLIRVYDSHCPHQSTHIPEMALQGLQLTCPKHNWTFDMRTGECTDKGDAPLKIYQSKVENGMLMVFW